MTINDKLLFLSMVKDFEVTESISSFDVAYIEKIGDKIYKPVIAHICKVSGGVTYQINDHYTDNVVIKKIEKFLNLLQGE